MSHASFPASGFGSRQSAALVSSFGRADAGTTKARQEGQVRIQTNISFFVAGPTGDGEEAQKLRDKARRTVYEMAARECDLLREILAKDCRMESVNNNIGRQTSQQQQEGYTVNGSMSFQITLK